MQKGISFLQPSKIYIYFELWIYKHQSEKEKKYTIKITVFIKTESHSLIRFSWFFKEKCSVKYMLQFQEPQGYYCWVTLSKQVALNMFTIADHWVTTYIIICILLLLLSLLISSSSSSSSSSLAAELNGSGYIIPDLFIFSPTVIFGSFTMPAGMPGHHITPVAFFTNELKTWIGGR